MLYSGPISFITNGSFLFSFDLSLFRTKEGTVSIAEHNSVCLSVIFFTLSVQSIPQVILVKCEQQIDGYPSLLVGFDLRAKEGVFAQITVAEIEFQQLLERRFFLSFRHRICILM